MLLLSSLIALLFTQPVLAVNENADACSLERGIISSDNAFTKSLTGTDFKITCAGALSQDLTKESIKSVLDSIGGLQEGVSKVIIDVSGVTSENHGINIVSDAGLTVLTGQLTNDASVKDGFAVTFRGEDPATNAGKVYAINVENRADITVKGEGRRGIRAVPTNTPTVMSIWLTMEE